MKSLEKQIKKEVRQWWITNSNNSKLLSLETLIKNIVTDRIKDLEKENAGLRSECRICVFIDSPCVRSDYPSKDGVCGHYKNVFDENTELRLKLEALEGQTPWKDIKDRSELIGKLTKAKELLKDITSSYGSTEVSEAQMYLKIKKAEQFLKDCEVEK